MTEVPNAPWWPPRPGDRLRHFALHGHPDGSHRVIQVHALVLVMAVFEHEGETLATVAEWLSRRQEWKYETIRGWLEAPDGYWPDGTPPPRPHQRGPGDPCDCCKPGARNPSWSDIKESETGP